MTTNLETTKIEEQPIISTSSLEDEIKQKIIDCPNEQTENTKILVSRTCIVKNQYGKYVTILMKNMSNEHIIKKTTQVLHYYSDLIDKLENNELTEKETKQIENKIDILNKDCRKFAAELIERNINYRFHPKVNHFVAIEFKDIVKRV